MVMILKIYVGGYLYPKEEIKDVYFRESSNPEKC